MKKEYNKSRLVFEKIVNPLLVKHMLDPFKYKGSCIAAGIPIKYLKYFKMVSRPVSYTHLTLPTILLV